MNLKRIIAIIVCMLLLFTPAAVFAETEGQKLAREAGFSVKWVDAGADFKEIWFIYGGSIYDLYGYKNTLYLVEGVMEDGTIKYGFINKEGVTVIPLVYDNANHFSDGLAYVELNGKKMFIDESGKEMLDVSEYDVFDGGNHFGLGYASISLNGKAGFIDKSGKFMTFDGDYDYAGRFKNGLFWVSAGGRYDQKYGFFDNAGKKITEIEYDYISESDYEKSPITVGKDGKYGFIDTAGKVVIPIRYEDAWQMDEDIVAVRENEKWIYFDSEGKNKIAFAFDFIGRFTEGLAYAQTDDKFGYIDRQGKIVIPFEYEYVSDFYNGAATVTKTVNGKAVHSLIDKTGEIIAGPKEYNVFSRTGAYIGQGEYYATPDLGYSHNQPRRETLLDKEGNRLTKYYMTIGYFQDGLAMTTVGAETLERGLINQHGAEIIPPLFDWIEIIDSRTCIVQVTDYSTWENSRVGILTLPTDAATRKPSAGARPITVYLDGLELDFDTEPKVTDGRTMVPMRKIFETLGADVSWDGKERKVTAVKEKTTVELTIGSDTAAINGEPVKLDVPAMIEQSRTLVPLRFVAEALDCDVDWDASMRRVVITWSLN